MSGERSGSIGEDLVGDLEPDFVYVFRLANVYNPAVECTLMLYRSSADSCLKNYNGIQFLAITALSNQFVVPWYRAK